MVTACYSQDGRFELVKVTRSHYAFPFVLACLFCC